MTTSYETDVVAWANEQAGLLRAGRFDLLDIENIAEEIEDVGWAEQRELMKRMSALLAHLLRWQYQPECRSKSWRLIAEVRRKLFIRALTEMPSQRSQLADREWWKSVWNDALIQAIAETDLAVFPETCPWTFAEIMDDNWLPEEES